MTELATTSTAPDNPTPAGPLTQRQAEPTRHDNQNPYASPPADRWGARSAPQPAAPRDGAISAADFARLPEAEKAKFANVRGANGGEWIERSKLPAEPADPAKPGATAAPGEKVKIGDFELSRDDVATILQEKAARDLRATQIPATPEDYQPALPETLKLPEGIEWKADPTAPELNDLRQLAKRLGWSQENFSDVLAIHVNMQATQEAKVQAAAKAELAKLGSAATMRVTAIDTFIRGLLGDDLGGAMKLGLFTEKQVRGWEQIMQKMGSQGAASFSQSHREPAELRGRVSESEWAAMGPGQRLDYSRQFDQKQFNNR